MTGTVTEATKTPEGTIDTIVADNDGNVTGVSAKVPTSAAKKVEKNGGAMKLPVQVKAVDNADEAWRSK